MKNDLFEKIQLTKNVTSQGEILLTEAETSTFMTNILKIYKTPWDCVRIMSISCTETIS